ncbi:hypothetical protein PVK64_05805 [Aliivibrio sp. S4TY2]|jgi:CII-binding regulator of phage lambda lysogenization HflD|uniref:Uncharacterized protein n=1 Tax=Aliivibrio finisterrensis TaxID=511998 RepID=A0A4Q5KGT9_9GAMM|nr:MULTISPECIES: hypothetical protein [Aliivibrio]KAB2823462.1 hypothetical protein F8B77_15390 [Aliivibrio finisterrensis]MDD9155699.1 hypothetical protein [Aliivibrio sp. S4TY2]MDD9159621.1 hypothetical protein [Aliivibrio sp. S4TY1]MDD9163408.1 hypothetical protein [Aliivibrio sp. S4MY2]MDD9167408.1 hypothetical protein [Aliivibrio sp. S4MY4]
MEKQYVMKLLSALKVIDKKISEQGKAVMELDARIKRIEAQNAKIAKMIDGVGAQGSNTAGAAADLSELDERLKGIEEKTAKAVELIRSGAGAGGGKKRAWPP